MGTFPLVNHANQLSPLKDILNFGCAFYVHLNYPLYRLFSYTCPVRLRFMTLENKNFYSQGIVLQKNNLCFTIHNLSYLIIRFKEKYFIEGE